MGMLGESGGIKYGDMADEIQQMVDQKAETYQDKNTQVLDSVEFAGEQHEDVAIAYVGEGTTPQVLYEGTDLEDDNQAVIAGNMAASAMDNALQSLDDDGAAQYLVVEADSGNPVSEDVLQTPLRAVTEAAGYMQSQEFDDRMAAHMQQMDEALESPEARKLFEGPYRDIIESERAGGEDALGLRAEAFDRLEQRVEEADQYVIDEVEEAAGQNDVRLETVFADSMRDHSNVMLSERMTH